MFSMSSESPDPSLRRWHHSPPHLFMSGTHHMVTCGTRLRKRLFESESRLSLVQSTLFDQADRLSWQLEAWAILPNHYHFIAQAPEDAATLPQLLRGINSITARRINAEDKTPGRQVWFRYWDTCLTIRESYFARLNYVHQNPVKHGMVVSAEDYPWCSMSWFTEQAPEGIRRTVSSFKIDSVNVVDDF
jgi:putative transposase